MTILTVLGYFISFLLAWVGIYVLAFNASRGWHLGKAQAESQAIQYIRRTVAYISLTSKETQRVLKEHADDGERILKVMGKLLRITGDMSRSFTAWAEAEIKRMGEFEDEPPIPPKLVS